ncbi:MAG: NUDIX domain-containing protein [Clostridia bacterium]|nr:NUDIX domain-containing protein [Clostridia bacterium]
MIEKTFGVKDSKYRYYDRIGAYLIAVQNNSLAVVRTPKGYFLPGGKIEEQESHMECIKRECLEEIGYSVTVSDYICSGETYLIHPTIGHFHPIQFYYSGKILEYVKKPVEQDHNFEWISCDEIGGKFVLKQQEWAVKKYLSVY